MRVYQSDKASVVDDAFYNDLAPRRAEATAPAHAPYRVHAGKARPT